MTDYSHLISPGNLDVRNNLVNQVISFSTNTAMIPDKKKGLSGISDFEPIILPSGMSLIKTGDLLIDIVESDLITNAMIKVHWEVLRERLSKCKTMFGTPVLSSEFSVVLPGYYPSNPFELHYPNSKPYRVDNLTNEWLDLINEVEDYIIESNLISPYITERCIDRFINSVLDTSDYLLVANSSNHLQSICEHLTGYLGLDCSHEYIYSKLNGMPKQTLTKLYNKSITIEQVSKNNFSKMPRKYQFRGSFAGNKNIIDLDKMLFVSVDESTNYYTQLCDRLGLFPNVPKYTEWCNDMKVGYQADDKQKISRMLFGTDVDDWRVDAVYNLRQKWRH